MEQYKEGYMIKNAVFYLSTDYSLKRNVLPATL